MKFHTGKDSFTVQQLHPFPAVDFLNSDIDRCKSCHFFVGRFHRIQTQMIDIILHAVIHQTENIFSGIDIFPNPCGTDLFEKRRQFHILFFCKNTLLTDCFLFFHFHCIVAHISGKNQMRKIVHRPFLRCVSISRCIFDHITSNNHIHIFSVKYFRQLFHIIGIGYIHRNLFRKQIHFFHICSRHRENLSSNLKRLRLFRPGKFIHSQIHAKSHFSYLFHNLFVPKGKRIKGSREKGNRQTLFNKRTSPIYRNIIVDKTINPIECRAVKIAV